MDLFDPEVTKKLNEVIQRDSKRVTKEMLADLKQIADGYKPSGYDAHHKRVRLHYEGKAEGLLKGELARRYPNTHHKMSVVPFNLVKHVAQVDASVYDLQPKRDLVEDGKVLEAPPPKPKKKAPTPDPVGAPENLHPEVDHEQEDMEAAQDEESGLDQVDPATAERVKAFQKMLKLARVHRSMPEVERRVKAAQTMFAVWRWDFLKRAPRLDMFWPNDVWVVPDPWDPADNNKSVAYVFRVGSGDEAKDKQWYEVWTRPRQAPKWDAPPTYGKWKIEYIREDGQSMLPEGSKDGTWPIENHSPVAVFHDALALGSPYLDQDRDLLTIVQSINVCVVDTLFTLALQGHTQLVYKGTRKEGHSLVLGPGVAARIGPNEELVPVDMNPKLLEMNETAKFLLKFLALTRSQSPDAYNVDATKDESGVSKRIANSPQEKKRRESVEAAKDFEENQLLPKAVAMYDMWGDEMDPVIATEETEYQFTAVEPPEFEPMAEKQTRLLELVADGYMTPAQVSVQLGIDGTVEDAVRRGLSNELKKSAPPLVSGLPGVPPLMQAPGEKPSAFQKRAAARMPDMPEPPKGS